MIRFLNLKDAILFGNKPQDLLKIERKSPLLYLDWNGYMTSDATTCMDQKPDLSARVQTCAVFLDLSVLCSDSLSQLPTNIVYGVRDTLVMPPVAGLRNDDDGAEAWRCFSTIRLSPLEIDPDIITE